VSEKKQKHHEEPRKEVHEEEMQEQTQEEETESCESEEERIEELEAKIKELEDQRLRDLAEFENIKKRMEKEKQQAIAYAHEQFARDMLAVIDSLDNALSSIEGAENSDEALEQIKEGIELTLDQFKKVFAKHGIELVDIEEGFNPHFHEAVMQVESDAHASGEIVQVLQKGYKIKDRVLRPAMVSVAK
jgi:molecular chaperone GrpE